MLRRRLNFKKGIAAGHGVSSGQGTPEVYEATTLGGRGDNRLGARRLEGLRAVAGS